MIKIFPSLVFTILLADANAQLGVSRRSQWVDLAATVGHSQGSVAASYVYSWKLGEKRKLAAGLGLRSTTMFGKKVAYTTAPARLARTNATPFLVVFAGQKTENWDTLAVQRPLITALNLTANLGYEITSNWSLLMSIDLVGFTLGRRSPAILTSNGTTRAEAVSKPTAINALLTGDLDYGTLNSEFSLRYKIDHRWAVRAIYQFIFTEYRTTTIKQTAPDGTQVERFRNKANNFGAGVSLLLKN